MNSELDTLRFLSGFMWQYTLVLSIVVLIIHWSSKKYLKSTTTSFLLLLPVIVAFFLFPINYSWYGDDFIVYAMDFNNSTTLNIEGHDALFSVMLFVLRKLTADPHVLYAVTSTIYVLAYVWACKRFTNGLATLSLFALCFGGPFFIGYMDNTLRAGLALSLTLLAYSYINESRVKAAFIALLAVNIHYSTLLPIIALGISYYYTKPKFFIWIWVLCIFVSLGAGSYFQNLFSGMVDDNRMTTYLTQDDNVALKTYKIGFRWDFVVYSLIPLVAGWYYIVKRTFNDRFYTVIYSAYILANSFWILVIRATFSDRFAYLSWFLMPVILAYPLLKRNTNIQDNYRLYCAVLAMMIMFKIYI
jgi:hypothetical protein